MNRRIHRDQKTVGMVEVAESLAVNPIPGVGENGASVPSFIDGPALRTFREIILVYQFQVLTGKAELPSHKARKTPEHAAAGLGSRLYGIGRAIFHNRQVRTIELNSESSPR
jgi:hypothetical protein